jgi:hypothetical protein
MVALYLQQLEVLQNHVLELLFLLGGVGVIKAKDELALKVLLVVLVEKNGFRVPNMQETKSTRSVYPPYECDIASFARSPAGFGREPHNDFSHLRSRKIDELALVLGLLRLGARGCTIGRLVLLGAHCGGLGFGVLGETGNGVDHCLDLPNAFKPLERMNWGSRLVAQQSLKL